MLRTALVAVIAVPAAACTTDDRAIAADRVWGHPRGEPLVAYTKGPVGEVIFEGFDGDGFLALPNLPLEVVPGPGLRATSYPLSGYPCATNDYCFLRAVLEDGVNELVTYVDVKAGTATQRFPVRAVRGEY